MQGFFRRQIDCKLSIYFCQTQITDNALATTDVITVSSTKVFLPFLHLTGCWLQIQIDYHLISVLHSGLSLRARNFVQHAISQMLLLNIAILT